METYPKTIDSKRFAYVLEKIEKARFTDLPFRHLRIDDLFSQEDFLSFTGASEVKLERQSSDGELLDTLSDRGFEIIDFPGCFNRREDYLRWRKSRRGQRSVSSTCEGKGLAVRLKSPKSKAVVDLNHFLQSESLQDSLRRKFDLETCSLSYDAGIQKYLDGYEISPHPDIRRKALTFMVNINPGVGSESSEFHTHYLRFRPEYDYIRHFWEHNAFVERCWVPWDWCETISLQQLNNSMVVFAPAHDTLHAVKARYDHLESQRTQLYGNFWFENSAPLVKSSWRDLQLVSEVQRSEGIQRNIFSRLPDPLQASLRSFRRRLRFGRM